MREPQRIPDERLAEMSEDDNLYIAQMAIDEMRQAELDWERRQHQDGPLVRAARAVERVLMPRR